MKNFQRHYDELLKNQAVERERMKGLWELYELKDVLTDYMDKVSEGNFFVHVVTNRLYITWYLFSIQVEDAVKHLLEWFEDLEFHEKSDAELKYRATYKNYGVKVELNLSGSENCTRVKVGDEVVPKYEYICY